MMDRDTIIRLAREAGLLNILEEHHNEYGGGDFDGAQYEELEHFAALVAAHEREACAKVCEDSPHPDGSDCAYLIRNRT